MTALVAYAELNGPTVWLIVLAMALTMEVISGRGWSIWAAIGAAVAAALTAWLDLTLAVEAAAFVAATALGVAYGLRLRAAAKRAAA